MQSGITLGNVVTEACTVALLQSGAADVPARVRVVDLVSTGCALPLGGWLVLAFDAPMAVVALGFALAAGAAIVTARAGGVYDHANARMPARFSLDRPRRVAVARPQPARALADAVPAGRERAGDDAVRRAAVPAREPERRGPAVVDRCRPTSCS